MKKEEILLQAIGMLPEEMAVEDVTEEILEGAANIEKDEKRRKFLHKCSYALATAACFAIIITGLYLFRGRSIRQPDTVIDENVNIITGKSSSEYTNIKFFLYGNKSNREQQKTGTEDSIYNGIVSKEVLYGKTVKLETARYIIFGMDRDFYFTIPQKPGKTYILNEKSGKKHFVKEEKVLCKAGNKVYFDISGTKVDKGSICNIEAWDKEGIELAAFTDIYLKNGKDIKKAARFYIGEKEKNKTGKAKKGDVYYGFLEIENGN